MSPTITATATETRTITLKPALRRKLLMELKTYAELKAQADALKLAMDKHKAAVAVIREETGETAIEIEGFKITYVAPTRKTLDPKLLIAQGVSMSQIESATVETAVKAYTKITIPGDKE